MKFIVFMVVTISTFPIFFSSCAAPKTSSGQARQNLEGKFNTLVGTGRKQDLIEQFGNPEWCNPKSSGGESCRFYKKKGTQWVGDNKRDKKDYEAFDEVLAEFDAQGVLQSFKANAQR